MKKKSEKREAEELQRVPFDDALRKILSAPPAHKVSKKKNEKKK